MRRTGFILTCKEIELFKHSYRIKFGLLLICIAGLASAFDDGILYYHGPPRLMKGGTKVRMVQEFVRIKIYKDSAKVYCRFVLKNEGESTRARIGFPDGNDHDAAYYETIKPEPNFKRFFSSVDGKPVKTQLEKADTSKLEFSFFHTKTVGFARNQTRIVEDWYEVPLDNYATANPGYYISTLSYVMWSGSSWNEKIGKATVHVDFMRGPLRAPILTPLKYLGGEMNYQHWDKIKNNRVFWAGFAKPRVEGNRLIFRRSNFDPTKADDIKLVFEPRIIKW